MKNPFNYPDDREQCPWCGIGIHGRAPDKYTAFNCGSSNSANGRNWSQSLSCRVVVSEFKLWALTRAFEHALGTTVEASLDKTIGLIHGGHPLSEIDKS